MSENYEFEKREFIRSNLVYSVDYKFVECIHPDQYPQIYHGKTQNVSGGGLLLHGQIPHSSWVPDLLMGKILVGAKILLPDDSSPIKALAKVSWVERQEDDSCLMGLRFFEIPKAVQDRFVQLILDHIIP